MLSSRRVGVHASAAFVLIAFAAVNQISQAASPDNDSAAKPQTYAIVDWPAPMNPRFVNLGGDRYLLATTRGMQIWDAKRNVFSQPKGWPLHSSLRVEWSRLGRGTLLIAASHSAQEVLLNALVWWNPETQEFSAALPLQPAAFASVLVPIDEQRSLVCMRTDYGKPGASFDTLPTKAAIVALRGKDLYWETDNSTKMQAALRTANVRGMVQGVGKLDESSSPVKSSPVIFNTQSCKWEMRQPPAELLDARDLSIKHHRLPDGRILVSQANWFSPARGVRATLAAPLLWDVSAGKWVPIDNTAQAGGNPETFESYGIDDPVVSVSTVTAEFVEFLDPRTLRWTRSQQTLPDTYAPAVAPLSTGEAIVFLREGGRILVVNPMREAAAGRLVTRHPYFGEIKLADGGLMLTDGGDEWHPANRPEILRLVPSPSARAIAPLPKPMGYTSGAEMQDGTVLVFGGLPPRCSPSEMLFSSGECGKSPAQPTYRYFPKQDRWEGVPGLALRFANGQFWDSGNSYIATQWPRNDAITRRNGDFVCLDGENVRQRKDNDWTPLVTTLVRWRPGTSPVPVANLRKGRTYATLLELADGRLAVIGGQAQQERVALEKQCFDCPDEFVSVGSIEWARSTEIFDDTAGAWVAGPPANHPGGRAVKLANGRIFKLSLTGIWNAESGYSAEVADAAFTGWEKLPPFPAAPFNAMHVTVSGNRVLILPQEPSRNTVVWDDDARAWSVWDQWTKQLPLTVTPIDGTRVLVRYYESYEIVSLPK